MSEQATRLKRIQRKLRQAWIAVHFWLRFGLQWREQYMKFGLRKAWYMAGEMLEFREWCRSNGYEVCEVFTEAGGDCG